MSVKVKDSVDVSSLDRSVVRRIMAAVGNPRISVRLWNGDEFRITDSRPVACMEFRSRRAVLELLRAPAVGFGECYTQGLIEVHGDFLAFANEITRAITEHRESRYYIPKFRSWLHALRRRHPALLPLPVTWRRINISWRSWPGISRILPTTPRAFW